MECIKYELAEELKDAGFIQRGYGGFYTDKQTISVKYHAPKWESHDNTLTGQTYQPDFSSTGGGRVYSPTLEELIEACGRHEFNLRHTYSAYENKIFYVIERPGLDDMERQDAPVAAVALLWLALNKK